MELCVFSRVINNGEKGDGKKGKKKSFKPGEKLKNEAPDQPFKN